MPFHKHTVRCGVTKRHLLALAIRGQIVASQYRFLSAFPKADIHYDKRDVR
jgi:hypothetical protein